MISLEQKIQEYTQRHDVVSIVNLDDWYSFEPIERATWLRRTIQALHRERFEINQRLIFVLSQGDEYARADDPAGLILTNLVDFLNEIDISNYFVVILAQRDNNLEHAAEFIKTYGTDPIPVCFDWFGDALESVKKRAQDTCGYSYNSRMPWKIKFEELTQRQKFLLLESSSFCIYPWIHMHVEPSGRTLPCCGTQQSSPDILGNTNQTTLHEIWNDQPMKDLRLRMLQDQPSAGCVRCYEQEKSGFFSMRHSANKHHGHHVNKVDATQADGSLPYFEMIYWDIRFNNLCNLRCRSCGPSFSSSWYQDQLSLAPDYADHHRPLIFAGKYQTDLWEQVLEHIDHAEQIYFAGGEPLIMDEHYRILEELERRGKFDVRLIYNTNFTEIKLKDRLVFDFWKKFQSVAVGASLDAMGPRAEYIRKGTDWYQVEKNRSIMLEVCPNVDFYVSATLSVLNMFHLPDFHKNWTQRGFIKAKDFNINLLTHPDAYRIDIVPAEVKTQISGLYHEHLAWLSPQDGLRRASNGYQSAVNFINAKDNSHLLVEFWRRTNQLDGIRGEDLMAVLPELSVLK